MATGDSYKSIGYNFRVGAATVAYVVKETCEYIWTELVDEYMPVPTETTWKNIAKEFEIQWNFPNCLGAIDGKHVQMQSPINSGSRYFNYKGFHSVVLMAVCDANYRFVSIEVGDYGRNSDGGVFAHYSFGRALQQNKLDIPSDQPLPGTDTPLPFVFVADAAFPAGMHLVRPYPGSFLSEDKVIFNYRLSRARRTIENTFGILAQRFRFLRRPSLTSVDNTCRKVKAATVLHNFLMENNRSAYCPDEFIEKSPETYFGSVGRCGRGANHSSCIATSLRNHFKRWFMREGKVSWQQDTVRRCSRLPQDE